MTHGKIRPYNVTTHLKELFQVLYDYAPNTACREAVVERVNRVLSAQPPQDQVKAIAGMLYDGLAYGNWPWIESTLTPIDEEKIRKDDLRTKDIQQKRSVRAAD